MVTDAAKLLPPNATPLEMALARAAPRSVMDVQASALGGIKHSLPDAFAPWYAAEWRLAEFSKYFDTTQDLIDAGLPWLRQRGTAAAVKRALTWIGFAAELEDAVRLQLDPGDPYAWEKLASIIHLVGASVPAHVQLYRLYHGYDLRPVVLDRSRLDGGLLDNDSGVMESGVKLSFGTRAAMVIGLDEAMPHAGMSPVTSSSIAADNSMRLDAWRLDSGILLDSSGGLLNQIACSLGEQTGEEALLARGEIRGGAIPDEPVQPADASRTDQTGHALRTAYRTWRGSWSGPWREPIPSKYTEELA